MSQNTPLRKRCLVHPDPVSPRLTYTQARRKGSSLNYILAGPSVTFIGPLCLKSLKLRPKIIVLVIYWPILSAKIFLVGGSLGQLWQKSGKVARFTWGPSAARLTSAPWQFFPADQQTRQFQVLGLNPRVPISTPEERMSTLVQPWRSSISQSRARPWGQNQPDANSTSGPTHILASDNPWPLIFLFEESYFSTLFWSLEAQLPLRQTGRGEESTLWWRGS